jgi:autotransporter-associated beta strand protein
LGSKTLTLNNPNGETFASAITGSGGKLVKNGTGQFKIDSLATTFDGGVTLNAGGLGIATDVSLGTGPLTINNSATLANLNLSPRTLTNAVVLNGNLTLDDSFIPAPASITWGTSGANQWTIAGADRRLVVNTSAGGYSVNINQVIGQDAPGRGLTKAGNGILTLNAANTYTGNTGVQAGTLSIASPYLADTSDVYLTTGSTFNLNFAAGSPDVIDSLFIDGVSQATGTWGAIGSGANHEIGLITGTGLLQVSAFIPPVPGDFNSNGKVDAGDYILWRKNSGTNNVLPNDNGLGTPVEQAHYNLWRDKFGNAPGSGNSTISAVPEPGALALLAGSLITLALPRRGCRRAMRFAD